MNRLLIVIITKAVVGNEAGVGADTAGGAGVDNADNCNCECEAVDKPCRCVCDIKNGGEPFYQRPPQDVIDGWNREKGNFFETQDAADADVVSQLSSLSLAGTDPCSPRSPRTPKDACVVCWERRREVACYPCMHVCLCAACAGAADACPMCRRPVEDVFRVFLS